MVDMYPDLSPLRPYVKTRVNQLKADDPHHLKALIQQYQEEHGPTAGINEALATNDGVEWWLHHCAEWRLEKMRFKGRGARRKRQR